MSGKKKVAAAIVKRLEAVKMPLTVRSTKELVEICRDFFSLLNYQVGNTPAMENRFLESIDPVQLFRSYKSILLQVINAYPQIFSPECGDLIVNGHERFLELRDITDKSIPFFVSNFCSLTMESMINVTDKYELVQKACCTEELIQVLLNDIIPLLSDIKWDQNTCREEMLNRSLDIVFNCCKLPTNHRYYKDAKAVDTLLKTREETRQLQNEADVTILLTLGYLLDDSNNDKIISGQGTIKTILQYVQDSLDNDEHLFFGFHLEELVTGLSHLAVQDENKDLICDAGGVRILAMVLEKAHNDTELTACCNTLWQLCFSDDGAKAVDENLKLKDFLSKLKKGPKKDALQTAASGVLWQLQNTKKKVENGKDRQGSNDKPNKAKDAEAGTSAGAKNENGQSNKHIMISYQWSNQKVVKRMADNLKERGYKVWMDIYNIQGFIMDDMAEAVEKADIIIACLSREYKGSPNTRRECDYAFQLSKNIIPVMMERNYRPDGWLGILLGTKLWTDFTDLCLFEVKMNELCARLGNSCSSTEKQLEPSRESPLNAGHGAEVDHFHGLHHPLHYGDEEDGKHFAKNQSGNTKTENKVSQWDNQETLMWITEKGISECIQEKVLKKIDGIHLVMLHKLYQTNTNFYNKTAVVQIGASDILDCLKFTYHLDELFQMQSLE